MSIFQCTNVEHQRELAELREIHRKEIAARDAEIARLNRALGAASSPRVVDTERISHDGGADYVRGEPSWT